MESITLHFDIHIKSKLMKFLENFSKNELKIIEENTKFKNSDAEMQKDYEYTLKEDAIFYTIDEVDDKIDKNLDEIL